MKYKSTNVICQNCKKDFTIEPDDFLFYEKIKVPPPTFCPECRNIQRLATRNSKSIYKRPCDLCGKEVISRFSKNNPAKMYCRECWWSDDWDVLSFGKKYDFSKTFHEQFHELLFSVPHASLLNTNMLESDYCNMETDDKRCYLTFGGHYNEDCAFTEYCFKGKEIYDSYWVFSSEQCSNCVRIENCYRTFFSTECYDCLDTYFSFDCRNCNNIIGCAGLRNKSYCIFNKQYTQNEFLELKKKFNFGSQKEVEDIIEKSYKIWNNFPHKNRIILQSTNCSGNFIINSKNCQNVWQAEECENSKNLYLGFSVLESRDETSVGADELCYMCSSGGGLYGCITVLYSFSADPFKKKHTFNSSYSYTLIGSENCFGCVGLRSKKYCILNKQYSKEEYEVLKSKIIKHMVDMPYISPKTNKIFKYGDFFPDEHSLFAYNETVAEDLFPKTKSEAEKSGYVWRDDTEVTHEFNEYKIPDDIKDVSEDILSQTLKCQNTGKAYKIIQKELNFYRKIGLPIPLFAPMVRIQLRVRSLLPSKIFLRKCAKCNIDIETPYSPDRPEIVYCEKCYQQEVY